MKNDKQQPERHIQCKKTNLGSSKVMFSNLKIYTIDTDNIIIDDCGVKRKYDADNNFYKQYFHEPFTPLSNETKVVESVEQAAENMWQRCSYKNDERGETIYIIGAKFGAQWQASQLKNTDAVKVITDRIVELEKSNPYETCNKLVGIQELKHVLKLIQP